MLCEKDGTLFLYRALYKKFSSKYVFASLKYRGNAIKSRRIPTTLLKQEEAQEATYQKQKKKTRTTLTRARILYIFRINPFLITNPIRQKNLSIRIFRNNLINII